MKKGILIAMMLVLSSMLVTAAKPTNTCTIIQDGTLNYATGRFLSGQPFIKGFDIFGYNYQAHLFSGSYANAYLNGNNLPPYEGDSEAYVAAHPEVELFPSTYWYWPYRDVNVIMKWNDAWLSNVDCDGDGLLDRHYGFDSYIGSGAWETNHQFGEYLSETDYHWDVSGNWLLDFAGGTDNREFINLVQDAEGNVVGEFWWLNGAVWEYGGTLVGTVIGDNLHLDYDRYPIIYTGIFDGIIGEDIITSGTFSDSKGNHLTWTATGTSEKVYETCYWSDFYKIVALPTADTPCDNPIWGEFCIIQEVYTDPCAGYEGLLFKDMNIGPGFGAWK